MQGNLLWGFFEQRESKDLLFLYVIQTSVKGKHQCLMKISSEQYSGLKIYLFFSVPPKLDLDLGSTVSSVSDPEISGASDKDTAKKGQEQKAGKQDEPAKPADGSQSEGKFFLNA